MSARERADFASPTGRIWCGLSSSGALCHFPFGYTGTVPASEQVCPGEGLDVTGVAISETGVAYFCSGDPQSMPDRGTDGVAWHRNTGFGFVRFDGHTLAVLPYGKALRHDSRVCVSERVGVTCADTVTRHGFRVSRAAVQLF